MPDGFGETPHGLDSKILNLANVLVRGVLRVPRYQRPYTWTEREVRRLIQDLYGAFSRRAEFYFIGQIVFVKNAKGELEISDGQQRTVTLTMLIAYARDRLPQHAALYQSLIMGRDGAPYLNLRAESAGFFHFYVQEPGQLVQMSRLDDTGVDPRDLMCAAARTITSELDRMADAELHEFMTFVCTHATFNVVDAAERGYAGIIYYTLNDPGLALSAADNLKCELLENSDLNEDERERAATAWEKLEQELGRSSFAKLLNLMPSLLTGEQMVTPRDLSEFRRRVEESGGVRKFLFERLKSYGDALRDIYNGAVDLGPDSPDVNRRIKMMMQLDDWHWAPAALAFIAEHSDKPERARRFFQYLERFAFACELGVIENRVRQRRFSDAARLLVKEFDKVFSERVLDLSDSERLKFIEQLNRSRQKDKSRRLLALRLEAAMPGGSILNLREDVTVEHVLPRNGGPAWDPLYPDPVLMRDAAHLLGNLVLITNRQNKRADNRGYAEKRQVYFNTRGAPVHALTRDIQGVEEWTLDAIDARQERLVRILCTDWDLVRAASIAA